jgi:hypothetical protein
MAKLEIEIDDTTGSPKEIPDALKKHVDSLVDAGFKARHTELRTKLEKDFAEKYKPGTGDPSERERLKLLEDENQRFKTAEAERRAEYEKALKIREEADAKREEERQKAADEQTKELTRRDARLRDMARSEIKIAAKNLGARTESLDELAKLLGADLDLDADLLPYVKGADGKPAAGQDGTPVTIEGYVKAYLDKNQHHLAPTGGTGGGSRGGASYTAGLSTLGQEALRKVESIQERIRKGDKSDAALMELYEANLALTKARAGGR